MTKELTGKELTGKEVALLIPARLRYEQSLLEFRNAEKSWDEALTKVLKDHGADTSTHGVDLSQAMIMEISKPEPDAVAV